MRLWLHSSHQTIFHIYCCNVLSRRFISLIKRLFQAITTTKGWKWNIQHCFKMRKCVIPLPKSENINKPVWLVHSSFNVNPSTILQLWWLSFFLSLMKIFLNTSKKWAEQVTDNEFIIKAKVEMIHFQYVPLVHHSRICARQEQIHFQLRFTKTFKFVHCKKDTISP